MSLSPIASSPSPSFALASAGVAAPSSAPATVDDTDGGQTSAVQVSLGMEAELTLTTYQATQISITASSRSGDVSQDGTVQDPETSRALSTLKAVAEAQREWIAAMKAQYEGRPTPGAQDATDAKSTAKTGSQTASGSESETSVQVTVQQETVVEASLSVGAEVDVQT
jgi:hypothetical protein